MSVALRRAAHLARDLVGDGLSELVTRGIVDSALAERLGRWFTVEDDREHEASEAEAADAGRDLDRLLRSLEHEAAMPELPFAPIVATELPAAESRVALTISGRHVVIAGRGGEGLVFVDDRPVGRPFAMLTAPTGKADVHRDPTGTTRITWDSDALVVELGPTFATATGSRRG